MIAKICIYTRLTLHKTLEEQMHKIQYVAIHNYFMTILCYNKSKIKPMKKLEIYTIDTLRFHINMVIS